MSTVYNKDNERLGILTVVMDTEYCGIFKPTDLYTYKYLKQKSIYTCAFKAKEVTKVSMYHVTCCQSQKVEQRAPRRLLSVAVTNWHLVLTASFYSRQTLPKGYPNARFGGVHQ